MYYTLYTSSDYYEEDDVLKEDESLKEDDVKICLICWLPNKNNDLVQNMKQISYILTTCDCDALFHSNCLQAWITNSSSCPICRKELTITAIYSFKIHNHIKPIIFFLINILIMNFILSVYILDHVS